MAVLEPNTCEVFKSPSRKSPLQIIYEWALLYFASITFNAPDQTGGAGKLCFPKVVNMCLLSRDNFVLTTKGGPILLGPRCSWEDSHSLRISGGQAKAKKQKKRRDFDERNLSWALTASKGHGPADEWEMDAGLLWEEMVGMEGNPKRPLLFSIPRRRGFWDFFHRGKWNGYKWPPFLLQLSLKVTESMKLCQILRSVGTFLTQAL